MKIKVGGNIGYKIQGKPYESIDVSSYCLIEVERDELTESNYEELNEKINELIKKENRKKLKLAIGEYKDSLEKIRSVI
jgi:NH3-dependent NAD+ synthetase